MSALVAALIVLVPILLALVLDARWETAVERKRVNDLLSRLAARTHGEYAAFAAPAGPPPEPLPEWVYDSTGLIQVEDSGE